MFPLRSVLAGFLILTCSFPSMMGCSAESLGALKRSNLYPSFASPINQRLNVNDGTSDVKRAQTHFESHEVRDGRLVGLAVSGGGSRAAIFGAAVMQELAEVGIMSRVDVISCVSGGCLPSAYYSLYEKNPKRWNLPTVHQVMSRNLERRIWLELFNPWNALRYAIGNLNRTDLLAQVLDDEDFLAGKTYGDLSGAKPRLLIHATTDTAPGRFVFSSEQFRALNSDLRRYPLSYAVAASAAFPGLLHNITIEDFSAERLGGNVWRRFVHLLDGGAIDNLAVENLLDVVDDLLIDRSGGPPWPTRRDESVFDKCVLILIDAAQPAAFDIAFVAGNFGVSSRNMPLDVVLDRGSIKDTGEILINHQRMRTLESLGIEEATNPRQSATYFADKFDGIYGSHRRLVNTRIETRHAWVGLHGVKHAILDYRTPVQSTECLIWHISLNNIDEVWVGGSDGRHASGAPGGLLELDPDEYEQEVESVANREGKFLPIGIPFSLSHELRGIETSLNLPKSQANTLVYAAKCLVHDREALQKVFTMLGDCCTDPWAGKECSNLPFLQKKVPLDP